MHAMARHAPACLPAGLACAATQRARAPASAPEATAPVFATGAGGMGATETPESPAASHRRAPSPKRIPVLAPDLGHGNKPLASPQRGPRASALNNLLHHHHQGEGEGGPADQHMPNAGPALYSRGMGCRQGEERQAQPPLPPPQQPQRQQQRQSHYEGHDRGWQEASAHRPRVGAHLCMECTLDA